MSVWNRRGRLLPWSTPAELAVQEAGSFAAVERLPAALAATAAAVHAPLLPDASAAAAAAC